MRATRRLAALACVAALAGGAGPAAEAVAHAHPAPARAGYRQVALVALDRLVDGGPVAGRRVNTDELVRATVCFHGICVHRRVRPDPVCDPSAGVCIGTALQAWRRHNFTVEVELA